MSDISLSKAVRSNLLSLQNTADLMGRTQERLATGNKVNSALDNPTNFFTAASLNSRASDMNALMDGMSNGIQTLEAADNGLSAITKTIESMQSTLRQARQDKTFQTASYELSDAATGNLTLSGGAIGNVGQSVALNNVALTATALGMSAAAGAGTDGTDAVVTAAVASTATGGSAPAVTAGKGGDIVVTVGSTDHTVTLADGDNEAAIISKINTAVGSTVAADDGSGKIVLTNSAGTGISVADASGNSNGTTAAAFGTVTTVAGSPAATTADATSGSNTLTWGGDAVEVNANAKISFTATIDGTDQKIEINRKDVLKVGNGDGTIDDAAEFASILTAKLNGTATASADATTGVITVTSASTGTSSKVALGAATVTGTSYTADELVQTINNNADLKGKVRASNDDGKLRIENQSTQELNLNGVNSSGTLTGTNNDAKIGGNQIRSDLADQFNDLRDQLDKLADDASFNGINLLRGDKLTITFNETGTSSIDIQAKDKSGAETSINSLNLGINSLTADDLDSDDNIDGLLGGLASALNTIRSQSSSFGSNLSSVQNRQDFTKHMVNTLQTGAANLTLADTNEEAANLLALQTRQQLSSTALSMASQSDQAVLRLF